MLKNLNQLAVEAQRKFNAYHKEEIILSEGFKKEFSEILSRKSSEKISYSRYTSVIITSSDLTITFPNQWFYIASYFVEYLLALKEYKANYFSIFQNFENSKEAIKQIKDSSVIPPEILTRIDDYFVEVSDRENFKKFLSDYSWWYGSKTIDRGDYYVSPILSLSKVVNVSQSYIADLALFLSENPNLLQSLQASTISIDDNNKPIKEELVEESSSIRDFAFSVFKHFYGNNWGDLVTQSIKKEASINNTPFISRDFGGFARLLGDFSTIQSKEELTSGGTQRYFEEPIYEADGRFFYFTTQWMGEGDGKLSFNQLKLFFEEAFPDYRFEKDDKKFRLFKKGKESVLSFNYKTFQKKCADAGLQFSDKMILRFVSSLCAKPFVICTGLSGSGKTKLAQSFAHWICSDEQQYKIIPVGADWTNREPLLGYPNSLDSKQYIKPENGVLDLILRAEKYAHLPHFLILDEMNLSHVERYFADFLSCMESGDYLHLHSVNEGLIDSEENIIPSKLKLPTNLFLIGTVNVDETTYMFSPKVLDRANVIEFRVSDKDLEHYLQNPRKPDMGVLTASGADMGVDFLNIARRNFINDSKDEKLNKSLLLFFGELRKCGAEFGFRSAAEITRLSAILNLFEQTLHVDENIDIAVMQKLLPKLHGSRNKIAKILVTLAGFCVKDVADVKKEFLEKSDQINYSTHQNVTYPLSLEKITRMYHSLVDNGYASYAEA